MAKCIECGDTGSYITEWSDSAEADPKLKSLVIGYPEHPDGTVLIECTHCNTSPSWLSVRLRRVSNIGLTGELSSMPDLMLALANRAEAIEKAGIDPLRESNWGTVFCHAAILAAQIITKQGE